MDGQVQVDDELESGRVVTMGTSSEAERIRLPRT